MGVLAVGAAPVQAYTEGAGSVVDRTDDPLNWGDGYHLAADESTTDGQVFWDGGTFVTPAETAVQRYRMLTGTVGVPNMTCVDDGTVTLTASATTRHDSSRTTNNYTGTFAFKDSQTVNGTSSSGTIAGATETGLNDNAAAQQGNKDISLTASATVPASWIASGRVVVILSLEVGQRISGAYYTRTWTSSGFSLDYRLVCPPDAADDAKTVARGSSTAVTQDLLANDTAEVEATENPATLDSSTAQLLNGTTWGSGPVTTDAGTYTISDGVVTFTPDEDFTGDSDAVTYRVANSDGEYDEATFTVNFIANAVDDSVVVVPGASSTFDVLANDDIADVDSGTLSLVDPDTGDRVTTLTVDGGEWKVVDGKIVFEADDDLSSASPPDPVTYVVENADGTEFSAVVTPTVAELVADDSATVVPGTPVTVDVLANDGIADADTDTLSLVDPDTGELVTTLTVDGGEWSVVDGKIVFTPNDDVSTSPPDPVTYVVEGADGTVYAAVVTLSVAEPATDDAVTVVPGQTVTVDVLSNDDITDVDPDTLSLLDPSTGELVTTLTVDGGVWSVVDGKIVFTQDGDVSTTPPGPVTYVVEDADGNPYSAVLTPSVADPAVDDVVTVVPGQAVVVDVLANDGIAGADPDTLRLVDPATGGLVSSLAVDGGVWSVVDGQIVFTPDGDVSTTPPGPVAYVVEDADGNPFSAVVTPTVAEPAVDDSAVVVPGTPVSVDVLANDGITDVDPDTLSLLDPSTGGLVSSLAVDGGVWSVVDGEVVFTPDDDVSTSPPGPVTYVVEDGDGNAYSAVVTLSVADPAVDDAVTVVPGQTVVVDVLANDGITGADADTLALVDPSTGGLVTSLTVDGGVWSVVDGEVVFTPDDDVSTSPPSPVTYVVEDADGNPYSAVVTPSVAGPAVDD
ncbi:MAG: hypothetical protein QM621_00820, partial [Aeromicrobium sp.]|uniref:Ig-like domain-containing protein n=1 Tax=Aeromicrobium sp. TaxID=1871063 RepID=UPI0039E2D74F